MTETQHREIKQLRNQEPTGQPAPVLRNYSTLSSPKHNSCERWTKRDKVWAESISVWLGAHSLAACTAERTIRALYEGPRTLLSVGDPGLRFFFFQPSSFCFWHGIDQVVTISVVKIPRVLIGLNCVWPIRFFIDNRTVFFLGHTGIFFFRCKPTFDSSLYIFIAVVLVFYDRTLLVDNNSLRMVDVRTHVLVGRISLKRSWFHRKMAKIAQYE